MNIAQLSNAKVLEEFENLFIYEKDYEDFFEDTYGTKNPDYNLYDLVAKYGLTKVVADFMKWQEKQKINVGDVVRHKAERDCDSEIVTRITADGDSNKMYIIHADGSTDVVNKCDYVKTGKNVVDKLQELFEVER